MLDATQCRAARALLGITQEELAALAEVSIPTIRDFERGARAPYKRTLRDLRTALEARGVVFIDEGNGVVGVKLVPQGTPAGTAEG